VRSRTEDFIRYWDNVRSRTIKVAELVPPDRIEWAPVDGAMTFGDLIRHLAVVERWMFVENVFGRPSRYHSHGRELADGLDAVLALLRELHADTLRELSTLTDEDLDRRATTPGGQPLAVWKWLRGMVEHEAHHRGQIYLMLRLCGVTTPPIFGLTSEEVRRRAVVD
jgi:uncharacterized damage-inducible protein DinB